MCTVYFNNWDCWYDRILDDFGFSREDDLLSAEFLDDKISENQIFNLQDVGVTNQSIIFGAGPSIKNHIAYIKKYLDIRKYTLIAADGANSALIEEDIFPDIIVTDLDSKIEDIIKSNQKKSILFVHAHGDNIDKLEKYLPVLRNIVPTCQCESFGRLYNFGGFTDGDRAVHIAVYGLKMNKIILAGMDYGNIVTRYSRPNISQDYAEADDFKKKKLIYARKLINSIKKNNAQIEITNLIDSI